MAHWTPAHHRQYQRTQRLLTAAENQLHKTRRKIHQLRATARATARAQRRTANQIPHILNT